MMLWVLWMLVLLCAVGCGREPVTGEENPPPATLTPRVTASTPLAPSVPSATSSLPLPASPTPPVPPTSTPTATVTPTLPPATPTASPAQAPAPPSVPSGPSVPVSEEEVLRGPADRPWIALVFNVGAGFEPATGMLGTLAEKQYRATFFVMGWWAERHPDLLRRIADAGHEIASHGHSVFDLTQVSDAEVRADLTAADTVIARVTGRTTRPLWSPSAGYRDARVRRIAASLGYRPILWTLDSGDWTQEATAAGVRDRVISRTGNGSIVVLHFDSPTTVRSTAVALPGIIDALRSAGYRLVTITELLGGGTP